MIASQIRSLAGHDYRTKRETIALGRTSIELELLADLDATIDQLFVIYQNQGKTELFEEMCPYFGTLWPAGRVLAHYLAENPLPSEPRILEIGCGLALPSLYLAKCGVSVAATDVHPDVPIFLARNREINAVDLPLFHSLDWRVLEGQFEQWDLVLASDVLYDKTQPESLLKFLSTALAPGGRVLLADPGRDYVEGFFDDAAQQGYNVKRTGLFGVLIGELTRSMLS